MAHVLLMQALPSFRHKCCSDTSMMYDTLCFFCISSAAIDLSWNTTVQKHQVCIERIPHVIFLNNLFSETVILVNRYWRLIYLF